MPKFDAEEYKRLINIAVPLYDPDTFCEKSTLKEHVQDIKKNLDWVVLYEGGKPDNSDTNTMLSGVEDEITRFQTFANSASTSPAYCKEKLESLMTTLKLILKAEGAKTK